MKEDIPHFDPKDCPNNIATWLHKKQTEGLNGISEQLHDYHLEVLDVKQNVVNLQFAVRVIVVVLVLLTIFSFAK